VAKQVITLLTDDLDGGEADQTVEFALDGIGYTIDLNDKNAAAFREFLRRHAEAGTRVGRVNTNGYTPGQTVRRNGVGVDHANFRANRDLNSKIRSWALDNGFDLADRGRIPQVVVDAYHRGTPVGEQARRDAQTAALPAAEPEPTPEPPVAKVPARKRTAAAAAAPAARRRGKAAAS
jgi:hypothetical protein